MYLCYVIRSQPRINIQSKAFKLLYRRMIGTKNITMAHDLNVSYFALEQLDCPITHSEAIESFDFALRLFDGFARILNNFKTSLVGFNKKFKRSELLTYHESHILLLNQFFKHQQFNIDLSIPIPSGMKVGYLQATTIVEELYKTLAIENTITTLQAYLSAVNTAGHLLPAEDTTKAIARVTKDSVETSLRHIFTADKTLEVPLNTVISSFDELIAIDKHILGYNAIFQKAESICNDLDKIEKIIDTLVTSLEQQKTPVDKVAVRSLYKLVMTASVQLDMLGVVYESMQRIEHNFVLVIRRLLEA